LPKPSAYPSMRSMKANGPQKTPTMMHSQNPPSRCPEQNPNPPRCPMATNPFPRTRAYRQPLSPAATAARIARSLQDHRALGVVRSPEAYTSNPATLALVQALLHQGETHAD